MLAKYWTRMETDKVELVKLAGHKSTKTSVHSRYCRRLSTGNGAEVSRG